MRSTLALCLSLILLGACDTDGADGLADLLTLEVTNGGPALAADGFSTVTLTATVHQDEIDDTKRAIVFTSSLGTLVGGTAKDGGRRVPLNEDNRASIQLRAGLEDGIAVVRATVDGASTVTETVELEVVRAADGDVVKLGALPASAPADEATLTLVTVRVADGLPTDSRLVSLTTTLGTFAETTTTTASGTPDGSGAITFRLKSARSTGPAVLRATVAGYSAESSLQFVRAEPEAVDVDPGGFTLKASLQTSTTVRARLLRGVGTVTPGTRVDFTATDSTGATVGFWRQVTTSNAAGEATASFSIGDAAYRGPVTFEARAEPSSVAGSARIEIVDP